MLAKLLKFVKRNMPDILIFIAVVLVCLLCFAMGYIIAKQEKAPIKFNQIIQIQV